MALCAASTAGIAIMMWTIPGYYAFTFVFTALGGRASDEAVKTSFFALAGRVPVLCRAAAREMSDVGVPPPY